MKIETYSSLDEKGNPIAPYKNYYYVDSVYDIVNFIKESLDYKSKGYEVKFEVANESSQDFTGKTLYISYYRENDKDWKYYIIRLDSGK